jgi:diadenosine tetraphosphate (Ap4A) HIT family hydrolase
VNIKNHTEHSNDELEAQKDPNCRFCDPEKKERIIASNETAYAVADGFPVTPLHMLVIPRRHTLDYFTMTSQERRDAEELIVFLREKIMCEDPTVVAFNIGTNCGVVAGQSVMHAHIHLIPRRKGDTENPRGGVRGVIPCKMLPLRFPVGK